MSVFPLVQVLAPLYISFVKGLLETKQNAKTIRTTFIAHLLYHPPFKVFHTKIHLMLTITSWNRYYYYYPRVTEQTETAPRGLGMYPQSHNWKWWSWDSRMVNLTPEPRSLSTPWYCLGKLLSMQILCTFWLLLLLLSQIGLPYIRKLVHFSFKSYLRMSARYWTTQEILRSLIELCAQMCD